MKVRTQTKNLQERTKASKEKTKALGYKTQTQAVMVFKRHHINYPENLVRVNLNLQVL